MAFRTFAPALLAAGSCLFLGGGPTTAQAPAIFSDSSYPSLSAACAAAGQGASLTVARAWPVQAGFACPASLQFAPGGLIRPVAGQTVTLLAFPNCPLDRRCYDTDSLSATGTVSVSGRAVAWISGSPFSAAWSGVMTIDDAPYRIASCSSTTACLLAESAGTLTRAAYRVGGHVGFARLPATISPVQWGADPAGGADSSGALNEVSYVLRYFGTHGADGPYAGHAILPCGNFLLARQWRILSLWGSVIEGTGGCTILQWRGDSATSAVLYRGNRYGVFGHFDIQPLSPSYPLLAGVEIQQSATSGTSQANLFEWLDIESRYVVDPMLFDAGPGAAGNNDYQNVERCHLFGSHSGIAMTGGVENYSYHISDSFLGDVNTSMYGVFVKDATGGASFTLDRGSLASKPGGWDIYIDGYSDFPFVIRDVDNETFGGYVKINSGPSRVLIQGGRWINIFSGKPSDRFQVFSIAPDVIFQLDHAQITLNNPARFATIDYKGGVGPFNYPNLFFLNSSITSNSFTYPQLFGDSYSKNFTDLGLQWTDGATSQSNFFEPFQYTAGTVSVTRGSPVVTGNGTAWTQAFNPPHSRAYLQTCPGNTCVTCPVASIDSATSIRLSYACPFAASGSGLNYTLGYGAKSATFNTTSAQATDSLAMVGNGPNYLGADIGTANHIASVPGVGPPLADGLTVSLKLGHTLQAGANTFAYQGGPPVPVYAAHNAGNLTMGYSVPGTPILLQYSSERGGFWAMVGQ